MRAVLHKKNVSAIFWLPFILFLIHSIEEIFFGFPGWATEHFGSTTFWFFIQHHIPLFILAFVSSYFASRKNGSAFWRVLATAWQIQFVVNGLFHTIMTIAFKEYSPGVVTGFLLFLPFTYYFIVEVWKAKLLTSFQFKIAFIIGPLVAFAAIASLWLES